MIELVQGDIFQSGGEAIVNPVNCVGVMGKGLALHFKKKYPENFEAYRLACAAGEVQPGRMFIHATGLTQPPRYIVNFPTKRHWREGSRYEDIKAGLTSLAEDVRRLGIGSLALPPLGCGLGGLDWAKVRPMIEAAFAEMPSVRVLLYEPTEGGGSRFQPQRLLCGSSTSENDSRLPESPLPAS
jgi:O-acetyl-ADP-ribose deacetylase (regulator of RNase III)